MSPEQLQKYRDLKDKIKKFKDEEERKNRPVTPPPKIEEEEESKTPRKMKKQVTYAPLPRQDSTQLPQMVSHFTSPPVMQTMN